MEHKELETETIEKMMGGCVRWYLISDIQKHGPQRSLAEVRALTSYLPSSPVAQMLHQLQEAIFYP